MICMCAVVQTTKYILNALDDDSTVEWYLSGIQHCWRTLNNTSSCNISIATIYTFYWHVQISLTVRSLKSVLELRYFFALR